MLAIRSESRQEDGGDDTGTLQGQAQRCWKVLRGKLKMVSGSRLPDLLLGKTILTTLRGKNLVTCLVCLLLLKWLPCAD